MGWRLARLALLLLSSAALGSAERTEPGPAVCDEECFKYGNCGEDGHCRCPFGRLGKNCEIDFLNPCKRSPDGLPNCGTAVTKSCECMRRCKEYFCRKDSQGVEWCEGHGMGNFKEGNRGCYEREGVDPDEQYSRIPEPDEEGVKCYSGHLPGAELLNCTEALVKGGDGENVPMSLCPDQCNNRGYCVRFKDVKEGPGMCRCHRGYAGRKCEEEENSCYLKCNGKGKCIDQFCHCEPPYFSIGCSRSKVYPANYSHPSPVAFKIYMYELNTQLSYDNSVFFGFKHHDQIYEAYRYFLEQFLLSPVRTEDPSEANLFFIPSFTYSYSGNVGTGEDHLVLLIDHIKHRYPWWNRTGGRDHFFWMPPDRGACHLGMRGRDDIFNPIKLVHFGMHTQPGHTGPFPHQGHPQYGCFNPLRDVVTAPLWIVSLEVTANTKKLTLDELLQQKERLFFFAGGLRNDDPEYSGGTRAILSKLVKEWEDPDFDFNVGGVADYEGRQRMSKFCLAPYGYGFGMRLAQAMLTGCVPVIIQEHVFQPYEGILPYETFSIRLTNEDLPNLRQILRGITDEQYKELLRNVMTYLPAFEWHAQIEGKAFDYTIAALRRTYMNLKALYYPVYSEVAPAARS